GSYGGLFINNDGRVGVGLDANGFTTTGNGAGAAFHVGNSITLRTAVSNGWLTWSDQRLKKDIKPIDNALDKIMNMGGYYYRMKTDQTNTLEVGVLAQEVEKVFPEVVGVGSDSFHTRSVDYPKLTPLLIQAIKEQQKQIDSLKSELCRTRPDWEGCKSSRGPASR
ncbi:MAG: tail fiber domain-containing protein, partial [Bdellovibrionota bacterium]